jgi:hypothetical protein
MNSNILLHKTNNVTATKKVYKYSACAAGIHDIRQQSTVHIVRILWQNIC